MKSIRVYSAAIVIVYFYVSYVVLIGHTTIQFPIVLLLRICLLSLFIPWIFIHWRIWLSCWFKWIPLLCLILLIVTRILIHVIICFLRPLHLIIHHLFTRTRHLLLILTWNINRCFWHWHRRSSSRRSGVLLHYLLLVHLRISSISF